MDPYNFADISSSIPNEDPTDDDLVKLEQELGPQSADYYGILNVSKKASDDELKEAYKKLCRFFHPDKHTNEDNRKLAESRFQVIQHAYEVLSDPQKRVIYDTYGEEGLNATWEVGPRYKSTEELRSEYERKARLKREQELENLVRSRAEFHLNLDVSQVLDPYEPPSFPALGHLSAPKKKRSPFHALKNTQVQQLFMRHSFETQVGPQTHFVIGGSMVSRTGIGGGNIMGTVRHTISPKLWGEFSANVLKPRGCTVKTYYTPSPDSFVNTTVQSQTMYAPPVVSVTTGRRLFAATTGYVTYRTGEWSLGSWGDDVPQKMDKSCVALGMAGTKKNSTYNAELQTGVVASHIATDYTHKLSNQVRLHMSGSVSTMGGIVATLGSDHKITKHTQVSMSLECGAPTGVAIKLKVARLGQKIVVPIILTPEFDLRVALFAAVLPASMALALDRFVLKPRRRRQIQAKIAALREEHADYLATRKKEALDAQHLMADIAARKKQQEDRKTDGLVIVEAWYGRYENLKDDEEEEPSEGVIDVTAVVQTLVNDSRLTIPGGHSKASILGFYDPCLGERKCLRVQYQFQHRLHEVMVEDRVVLSCPMQAHAV